MKTEDLTDARPTHQSLIYVAWSAPNVGDPWSRLVHNATAYRLLLCLRKRLRYYAPSFCRMKKKKRTLPGAVGKPDDRSRAS